MDHGFAPPPLKKFSSKAWGEKTTWIYTLQLVCTHLTTSTGARCCIIDSAKIFHCRTLPYINQTFLAEIFLGGEGEVTSPKSEIFQSQPPPPLSYVVPPVGHSRGCLRGICCLSLNGGYPQASPDPCGLSSFSPYMHACIHTYMTICQK